MRIKTNSVPRPYVTISDLGRSDQDLLIKQMGEDGLDPFDFIGFKYLGIFYEMGAFSQRCLEDGWRPSFEHQHVLIRLNDVEETVVVGVLQT